MLRLLILISIPLFPNCNEPLNPEPSPPKPVTPQSLFSKYPLAHPFGPKAPRPIPPRPSIDTDPVPKLVSFNEPARPKKPERPLPDNPHGPYKPTPDRPNPNPDRPMYGHDNFPSASGSSFTW